MKTWARKSINGYEVSSKGDKRFSAMFALMSDGRSIECHYQCDVKGYNVGGYNWKLGKGKPPLDKSKNMWKEYLSLWVLWSIDHPDLMAELIKNSEGKVLTDMFASTDVNQARALAVIITILYDKLS